MAAALTAYEQALLRHLEQFVSGHKQARITRVLGQRTDHLALLLENIYQSHNASAVLRTAECFGIQDVHVLAYQNAFAPSVRVSRGSYKWLSINQASYAHEQAALAHVQGLRAQGYRLVATTPHKDAWSPDTLPLEAPLLLAFGREMTGLSDVLLHTADYHLSIPMQGFTESLNLSVSAAIILQKLSQRLRASALPWAVSAARADRLRLEWYRELVKQATSIEKEFERQWPHA